MGFYSDFREVAIRWNEPNASKISRMIGQYLYRKIQPVIPCDITRYLVLDVHQAIPPNNLDDYSIKLLSAEALRKLPNRDTLQLADDFINDMQHYGFRCLAAFNSSQLLGYTFFTDQAVPGQHNSAGSRFDGIAIEPPERSVYMFKGFVLPDYRSKHIIQTVLYELAQLCIQDDKKIVFTTTDWTNTAALTALQKINFIVGATAVEVVIFGKVLYKIPSGIGLVKPDLSSV